MKIGGAVISKRLIVVDLPRKGEKVEAALLCGCRLRQLTAHLRRMDSTLDELRAAGGDLSALCELVRTSRPALQDALKTLGFAKMGVRKKMEQALVAHASSAAHAGAAPAAEDIAATGEAVASAAEGSASVAAAATAESAVGVWWA